MANTKDIKNIFYMHIVSILYYYNRILEAGLFWLTVLVQG
jgi:hypothetical protein